MKNKAKAGGAVVGGALATLLVVGLGQVGFSIDAELSAAIQTVITAIIVYFAPRNQET